jgi:hypothetical protein
MGRKRTSEGLRPIPPLPRDGHCRASTMQHGAISLRPRDPCQTTPFAISANRGESELILRTSSKEMEPLLRSSQWDSTPRRFTARAPSEPPRNRDFPNHPRASPQNPHQPRVRGAEVEEETTLRKLASGRQQEKRSWNRGWNVTMYKMMYESAAAD